MSIDCATSLKALKLYGMATAWSELQSEKPRQVHRPETWMERLLQAEQTDRKLRSLCHQLKVARFPIHRDLTDLLTKVGKQEEANQLYARIKVYVEKP